MTKRRSKIVMGVFNPLRYDTRVQRAAETLALDHDVLVVSPGPSEPMGLPGVRERIVGSSKGLPLALRLPVFWARFVAIVMRERPDVVHAHDFTMAAAGRVAASLGRGRFVYDAHELIIPEEGAGGPSSRWRRHERWALKKANTVVVAEAERGRLMSDHYGIQVPIVTVRNLAPEPPGSPRRNGTRRVLGPKGPDEVRFVYQGDVNMGRGLDRFIRALAWLPEKHMLVVVGGGVDADQVPSIADGSGVAERVRTLGRIPAAELPEVLRACDIGIVTYPEEGLNNLHCAPNKVFEYAWAGLPIVASSQPTLTRLVDEYGIGGIVPPRAPSPDQDAEAVARVMQAVAAARASHAEGLGRMLDENSWEAEAVRLRNGFEAVLHA